MATDDAIGNGLTTWPAHTTDVRQMVGPRLHPISPSSTPDTCVRMADAVYGWDDGDFPAKTVETETSDDAAAPAT